MFEEHTFWHQIVHICPDITAVTDIFTFRHKRKDVKETKLIPLDSQPRSKQQPSGSQEAWVLDSLTG